MDPMGNEIAVPLDALTFDGEDAKSVSPAVGDPVEFEATGTVARVDGQNAYITLESVNEVPVTPAAPDPMNADPMADAGADLRSQAQTADDEMSTY